MEAATCLTNVATQEEVLSGMVSEGIGVAIRWIPRIPRLYRKQRCLIEAFGHYKQSGLARMFALVVAVRVSTLGSSIAAEASHVSSLCTLRTAVDKTFRQKG